MKVGDKVVINTKKYDARGIEFGKMGTLTKITKEACIVTFPPRTFKNQVYETSGIYDIEDLRPLSKLEKVLE